MDALLNRLKKFRDERDWQQFHTPKDLAISVSVEAAELLELFQWRDATLPPDDELIMGVRNEAADVFIYLLLLCDGVGVDLLESVHAKIDLNERRFPSASARGVAKPTDREKA